MSQFTMVNNLIFDVQYSKQSSPHLFLPSSLFVFLCVCVGAGVVSKATRGNGTTGVHV